MEEFLAYRKSLSTLVKFLQAIAPEFTAAREKIQADFSEAIPIGLCDLSEAAFASARAGINSLGLMDHVQGMLARAVSVDRIILSILTRASPVALFEWKKASDFAGMIVTSDHSESGCHEAIILVRLQVFQSYLFSTPGICTYCLYM